MEPKIYNSFEQLEHEIKFLKLKREIHYQKIISEIG
jgi:hypothetical protein